MGVVVCTLPLGADVCFGRQYAIRSERAKIKRLTMQTRQQEMMRKDK